MLKTRLISIESQPEKIVIVVVVVIGVVVVVIHVVVVVIHVVDPRNIPSLVEIRLLIDNVVVVSVFVVVVVVVFVVGLVVLAVVVNVSHRKPIFKVWSKLSQLLYIVSVVGVVIL